MPRRKRTPEEIARKERTKALMKELNIKDMDDIQDLFKSFVAAALEGGLEAELDEELGYSKYDYRNKETNNSRNGYRLNCQSEVWVFGVKIEKYPKLTLTK